MNVQNMIKLNDPYTSDERQRAVDNYCSNISLSKLLSGLKDQGEFAYLRFIFKNNPEEVVFGKEEFLLITMQGYRKVVLNDLNYSDNKLHMEIRDCKTGRIEKTTIDINHSGFKFIMISWTDLQEMIFGLCRRTMNTKEILDFEF